MKKTTRYVGIGIGVVVLGLVLMSVLVRLASQPARASVLELELHGALPEEASDGGLVSLVRSRKVTLRDTLEAIHKASRDTRVNGLLLSIDGPEIGFATAQELRDAVRSFRDTGKWAVAYMETAGEFSPGNRDYYLAAGCDAIWLAPSGDINLTGMRWEVPFIRGTLDKLGVYPDFDHIGRYKNAMNSLTHTRMDEAHREAMDKLADSLYGQLVGGIARGRGMTDAEVATLIDQGPFMGPRALEMKLVDNLGYRDEMEDHLKETNGGQLPLVKVKDYLRSGRYYDHGPKLALITGVGTVTRGDSYDDPFIGGQSMGSNTIAGAIRDAREDASVKAIVFRVNSPGGSYVASDLIWREVSRTRGVKPIVVSMSDVAASGGYFVSIQADRIIAQPATLTASIGVLAGKMVTSGFWNTVGVTSDAVQRGRHATFYSSEMRYAPEERAIFQSQLKRIYGDFVGKVAEGRGKTVAEIDVIAQGRVWTGEDAVRLGLVDELGGLDVAIRRAQELAGLDPRKGTRLVVFPAPKSMLQRIMSAGPDLHAAVVRTRDRVTGLVSGAAVSRSAEEILRAPFLPRFE